MAFPLALIPFAVGAISSLLGKGKGKEVPRESEQASKNRDLLFNFGMERLKQGPTQFAGKMPGLNPGFAQAQNVLSSFYGGKPFTPAAWQSPFSMLGTSPGGPTLSQATGTGQSQFPWASIQMPQNMKIY